jgi:hypothetical protein
MFYTLDPTGTMASERLGVEASEQSLYDVPGLHVSGVRIGVRAGPALLVAEAAQLAADVGRETRVAIAPSLFASNRWAASLALAHESVAVDGMEPAHLVSATVRSLVRLSGTVTVGGEVARYRLDGEAHDGADVTLAVLARPLSGALIRAVVGLGRWGGAQPSLSTTVGALDPLRVTVGYDAATEAIKGALAVRIGALSCAAGAHHHPTLGPRYGVSVAWGRR